MGAPFRAHQAIGIPARNRDLRRHDPGFSAFGHTVEGDREAAPLTPLLVHAQQHLGEVLGVDSTILGVDLHDAVGVVVLAGEHAAQLKLIERCRNRANRRLNFGLQADVVFVARQLMEHLDVFDVFGQRVERLKVIFDVGVLGVELLSACRTPQGHL